MGYLNKATITVDAILTNRGRELLAQGASALDIKKFAVADDEIDYGLYNIFHPEGSQYYGAIIENMPVLEATPDEQQIMRYKLVTLEGVSGAIDNSGNIYIPAIDGATNVALAASPTGPTTLPRQFKTTVNQTDTLAETYTLLVANARLVTIELNGAVANPKQEINANGSITITEIPANVPVTFKREPTSVAGTTTATVFGNNSGATATFKITVS
jgi:hypothetical protein